MFIKLTRFDNRPVWLNAAFIVTVEPRRDGVGSVIVPIGDGFDYDVRESVAEILEKLDGAPAATVVPVPAPDCLTKTPADVSPEPVRAENPADKVRPSEKPVEEKKPRKRMSRKTKTDKTEKVEKPGKADAPEVQKDPDAKAVAAEEKPVEKKPLAPFELTPDQVVRLSKLAPKSVSKLKNTLATQFHVADVGATVLALEAKGVISLDGTRVIWPVPSTADVPQM